MPNPILDLIDKHLGPHFVPRLKQQALGLAADFWADGSENLLRFDFNAHKALHANEAPKAHATAVKTTEQPQNQHAQKPEVPLWHAAPGEVSEKMWGDGFVTPGDETITALLIKPLGLNNEMNVLDLSAGLGGRLRRTAEETGAYITGLEPDPTIAARGMELSKKAGKSKHAAIAHYDPSKLVLTRAYDCIIARETFYRLPDRAAFFATLAQHSKPRSQIAFTDYIVDPEYREQPAVLAWRSNEKLANPLGLVEMAEAWAKVGFSLRVHEDLSDAYKAEVKVGMKKLVDFLATGIKPDPETGAAIVRRTETWVHRMAAMDAGMKFYRFYGTKR